MINLHKRDVLCMYMVLVVEHSLQNIVLLLETSCKTWDGTGDAVCTPHLGVLFPSLDLGLVPKEVGGQENETWYRDCGQHADALLLTSQSELVLI